MDSQRVGIRLRGRALLIDAIAFFLLWFGAAFGTQALAMSTAGGGLSPRGRNLGIWFLLIVTPPLPALAYAACDVFFAGSPGKMLLKLRIADATGRRATRGQLVGRFAVKFAWLLALVAWLAYFAVYVAATDGRGIGIVSRANGIVLPFVGLLALAVAIGGLWTFKPDRQALHDRLTRTAVFRKADVTASSFEPVFQSDINRVATLDHLPTHVPNAEVDGK